MREQIVERLRQECAVELSTLVLQESDKTLYTKIRISIGETQPAALIVFGLESVRDLEQMLASTNQVREEFRKNFHFPLVLWIVVDDCGAENKQTAELLLYLLTDEKGTRPLKTRADLERDLQELSSVGLSAEAGKLDLVLQVFVESGLVLLLPEKPAERYQLVHDYLAAFIRQQQEPKLKEVMVELEREKEQRRLSDEQRKLSDAKLKRLPKFMG